MNSLSQIKTNLRQREKDRVDVHNGKSFAGNRGMKAQLGPSSSGTDEPAPDSLYCFSQGQY